VEEPLNKNRKVNMSKNVSDLVFMYHYTAS